MSKPTQQLLSTLDTIYSHEPHDCTHDDDRSPMWCPACLEKSNLAENAIADYTASRALRHEFWSEVLAIAACGLIGLGLVFGAIYLYSK